MEIGNNIRADFYKILENELKTLKRHTKLYYLLKTELSKHGYWKNKARGNGGNITINSGKHKTELEY